MESCTRDTSASSLCSRLESPGYTPPETQASAAAPSLPVVY